MTRTVTRPDEWRARDVDRAGTNTRDLQLSEVPSHRLESRADALAAGNECRRNRDEEEGAAQDGPAYRKAVRLALPWLISPASARSSSASRTSARSPGRSPARSPTAAHSSRSPTRASASSRASGSLPRASSSPLVTACDVRSDDDVARVFVGGRRHLRRWPRHPRPLGRLRRRGGSRGPLHGHAARPLLARGRRQRLLARRVRPRGGAADGGRRRRLDPDDDLPRRRAGRAALQRDGRREGDARRVRPLPRLGSRARRTSASTRSRPDRCARWPRARSPASRRWRRSSRSARRSTGTIDADDVGAAAAYLLSDDARNVTATTLYVDSGYHAMGM